jgi:hypothetical protein
MITNDTLTHAMQKYQSPEEPERLFAAAGKYWRIMLSIEVLICVAAVVGGAYMLVMTFFYLSPDKTQDAVVHSLNQAQLKQVISGFNARQAAFEGLPGTGISVSDPSR